MAVLTMSQLQGAKRYPKALPAVGMVHWIERDGEDAVGLRACVVLGDKTATGGAILTSGAGPFMTIMRRKRAASSPSGSHDLTVRLKLGEGGERYPSTAHLGDPPRPVRPDPRSDIGAASASRSP
ncbi:hypothetical protein CJO92_22720 (plasmid) [Ralstonia solanacearum]|uniref:Uncharacterized protein n=3 Tax=Ralstonia solanacearum species complex TaxID=3116862 RepID=A0AAD0SBH6_RALSL|nr:hypothetical protein B0B51_14745 [blood disease bacterium A2-HR MARDI]AXV84316.1 hypothetical protein CJO77_22705 [Ralstonia solanacearum]AXW55449.1 hypothetical protein CJO92_22720 [Ralstonia solanacearum]CBJ35635.1 hypothethical protein [Ralstonia solanacearum PSI07]CCA81772.1 hypothethical protein [blood disease bacterium R229]